MARLQDICIKSESPGMEPEDQVILIYNQIESQGLRGTRPSPAARPGEAGRPEDVLAGRGAHPLQPGLVFL